jgi:hypothetical protein
LWEKKGREGERERGRKRESSKGGAFFICTAQHIYIYTHAIGNWANERAERGRRERMEIREEG